MADGLNLWIKEVENLLSDLAPGERAQAVIELDRQLRKLPLTTYDELCRSLGTPTQVANRYKLQYGKNPFSEKTQESNSSIVSEYYKKTSSRPVGSSARRFFKAATWLLIALIILIILPVILVPVFLFKFFAVDHFDKDFNFSFGNHKPKMERLAGHFPKPLNKLDFSLNNGQVEVITDANATEVSYDCEIEGERGVDKAQAAKVTNGNASIVLQNIEDADCDLTVPPLLPLSLNITNGRIEVTEAEQNVEANLTNGEIEFSASPKATYDMKPSVQIGSIDGEKSFASEQKKKKGPQFNAVLSVGNGRINLD